MENTTIKLQIILGSTRQGRFSDKPGQWMLGEAQKLEGVEAEIVDLRDWPLPFFDDAVSPAYGKGVYTNEAVKKFAAKISEADGFVIVAPEYNHGYPAVLKNALDSIFFPWNDKPVCFVGYGNAMGARSIEQLRQVVIELQMTPIRFSVHIPGDIYKAAGGGDLEAFAPLAERAAGMLGQLAWFARTIKAERRRMGLKQ